MIALPWRKHSALVALVASAPFAAAQSADSLQSCMEIADDSLRLACFETIANTQTSEAPPHTAEVPVSKPAPDETRTAVTPPLEKPAENKAPSTQETVTVVYVDGSPQQSLVFYLASGEVWLQTRQRFVDLPEPPFAAHVSRGAFGSYRLRLHEKSQAIGIRRIQ